MSPVQACGLGPPAGALASTIGPLSADPGAAGRLDQASRDALTGWLEQSWSRIEARVGPLARRDASVWYELLCFEGWREHAARRGLPSQALAAFYAVKRLIPRGVQLWMRRSLIARQGLPRFPAWPFEPAGYELVRIALAGALLELDIDRVRFPWFWPHGATAAVTLTHDVESSDGLARAGAVAAWEERHGFRSSFNVVAEDYPLEGAQLGELRARGHEIGSHAIHHDRSLFASRASFERQLPLLAQAAEQLQAVGFRSPATHRVVAWLSELPFSYDCTMPHSDPYEPIPGGTGTVWPHMQGPVVELPYTAPQDHTLFNLLGHRDGSLWTEQLRRVIACNGLFQTITHPDAEYLGRPPVAAAYRELLAEIAGQERLWVALPRDVAQWWRKRTEGRTPRHDGSARWDGSQLVLAPAEVS